MSEAGLLSGQTLVLGRAAPMRAPAGGGLFLAIASGPDTGMEVDLTPGSFLVGRDTTNEVILTDPQVSRRHLVVTVAQDDTVTIDVLAKDRNEVRTDGERIIGSTVIRPDQVVRVGASSLVIRTRPSLRTPPVDAFGQVPFHRTPYFPAPVQEVTVDAVRDIPTRPEKSRFAYLSALLPLIMGVTLAVLFNRPYYLLFAVFSPLMVIGNYFEQRRRSGRKFDQAVERFQEMLVEKTGEVRRLLAAERLRRVVATPDIAGLKGRAVSRAVDLWVRDRTAHDFLRLRVGLGDLPTALSIDHSPSGDAEFRDQIVEAYGQTDVMTDVPVTLDLAELGVVGLVGRAVETSSLLSSLAIQAACLHSPEDLVVLAALSPARELTEWLKWAPHSRSSSSPVAGRHLVGTKEAADQLIADLTNEATRRLAVGADRTTFPWLLVFLDRAVEPDAAAVSRLLDACPAAGISIVWLTDTAERVPRQARAVVTCRPALSGELSTVSFTDPDREDLHLDIDRATAAFAARTGMALAPLRDASSANAATAIPRVVPLFTALGIEAVDEFWIEQQWKTDRGYSLQGPIGYTDTGPLILDIVEHGPHGLIGGTSGAGKSELVMSMVAGLIAYNPPTRINFLFIDYKGGASSDLFKDVPHTVGYVTNLDGLLAMRALTSLRAELNRRMNLLQGKAKDLAEMIEKYPDEAPPSLVIVVDEFATLVKEIPDFVAGIVDIAQRGRSLGIHLMLATQRPSGSVNDNIKANTNLRISLRMLDGAESTAVIGVGDAAAIPAPLKGRGFAKMGPGELVAFQSAWSGAPLLAESGTPPVVVRPFGPAAETAAASAAARSSEAAAPGSVIGPSAGVGPDELQSHDHGHVPQRTQIDALLEAVCTAGEQLGHRRGDAPWLEVLPPVIPVDDVRDAAAAAEPDRLEPGARIVIGMIDDPAAQAQYPAVVNLARSGGLIISGTGGSGKSTALITAAVSAAMDDSALGGGTLTIFALDFASRELGGLNRLPQCGGVATGDDLEAVTRIIGLLHREFERRRQALADAVARAEVPAKDSAVLFLIDGMEAIIQTMEQGPGAGALGAAYAQLTKVLTDGRQVGIHPIIATARQSAIRSTLTSAISDRLTLRQADIQGYTECGISAVDAKELDLAPGQGFFNGPTTLQVASLFPVAGPGTLSDEERERHARENLLAIAGSLIGRVDPRLVTRPLPSTVPLLPSSDPLLPVVGRANLTGEPYVIDLTHNNVSVIGDPRSGRTTALATIGKQAAAGGTEVWILGSPGSPLRSLGEATMSCFAEGPERAEFLEGLAATVERSGSANRLFLLDDHDRLPDNDRELIAPLERLLGTVRYAVSGPKPRGFSPSPIVQLIKACRTIVYLKPHDDRESHEVLGVPVPWHPGLPMQPGRGFVVVDRVPTMVQLSTPFTN
ncbi:MAG: FtsK/SpoIIIE domain-containing protein [Actinomycetota bacterium]